ncbi:MAG TPA: hypothetical protein VLH61_04575 [Bacteroidales bacterium]|nr:hypothetical protein [Bacteroidales bacterium]
MKIKNIKSWAGRHWHNIPGWRTNRKIVVFESDDWGSIRMPSREVYESLLEKGIRVDKLSFLRYDSLASETDLTALFDVLSSVKDIHGNPAVFTANTVVANPDFEKIRANEFKEYRYEPFTTTLSRYPSHKNSFKLWQEGIGAGVFHPQFHGREHLNVARWLDALRQNSGDVRLAFEYGMYDLSESGHIITENSFMDALSYNNEHELENIKTSLKEGLGLFETLFGYKSKSFIASCYIWSPLIEKTLADCGVMYIQGGRVQKIPIPGSTNNYLKKLHYTGQKNEHNQTYLVRNCFFEPGETGAQGLIEDCIKRIRASFFWKKPAIIGTHRLNYIGSIFPENRDQNLNLLKQLLMRIIKEFPEVEFFTSDGLGDLIQAVK